MPSRVSAARLLLARGDETEGAPVADAQRVADAGRCCTSLPRRRGPAARPPTGSKTRRRTVSAPDTSAPRVRNRIRWALVALERLAYNLSNLVSAEGNAIADRPRICPGNARALKGTDWAQRFLRESEVVATDSLNGAVELLRRDNRFDAVLANPGDASSSNTDALSGQPNSRGHSGWGGRRRFRPQGAAGP